jgi:hypothetical protein
MNRRTHSLTIVLAALMLVAALSLPGIFMWPLNALRMDNYYMDGVLLVASMDALRILFLVIPVVSLIGAIRGKRWALYGVMAFPVIAWVFGAGAIPYLSHLFAPVTPRTIAITVINLAVVAAAVWLRWGRSNNSFKPKPLRGSA